MGRLSWQNAREANECATLSFLLHLWETFIRKGRIKLEPSLPTGLISCDESSIKV